MGLFTNDEKSTDGSSELTIISEHLSVTGEINGSDNVYINGTFKGRIVTQGELTIGPKGKVDAEIHTKSLLVSGYLEGMIDCESATIFPTGRVIGKLCSSTLQMHPGGYYFGENSLRAVQPAPATPADESKTFLLSTVGTQPAPKEPSSVSAFASTQEVKKEKPKSEQTGRDKFITASGTKPAASKLENLRRPTESSDINQDTGQVPNETSEPRRWHSSWGRR
jgi:cytoskeletal protein CcmA (bactofilin family)